MDPQWRERGLCSHSPLLSGPLRQPSDSGLPVATPLSSSCHRGSLGSSYSVYYYLSRRRGGALCLVAYCVPTPGFQSATCSVHYYRGCGLFPPPHTHTNKLRLSFGHLNRTQTFTYHSHSYIPGLIIMFPHSECFCPIERAGCWRTSTPPPRPAAPGLAFWFNNFAILFFPPLVFSSPLTVPGFVPPPPPPPPARARAPPNFPSCTT